LKHENFSLLPGLYLHIPFCHHKCGYCDFYSITQPEDMELFVGVLLEEIVYRKETFAGQTIDTVYFGGGTPSLLSGTQINRLMSAIRRHYALAQDTEITLEANPGTVDTGKLAIYRDAGVNRISMGAQSFAVAELEFLERIHSADQIALAVEDCLRAGINKISVDLLSALPGQSLQALRQNLQKAVALPVHHLSVYTLIIEENTRFGQMHRSGLLQACDSETEAEHYEQTLDFLAGKGFEMYEVSNFARGQEYYSRHNQKYWNYVPYLGLGPSAHSFDGHRRWANKRDLKHYLKGGFRNVRQEELNRTTQVEEYAFLALRQKRGIDKRHFRQLFGVPFDTIYADFIARFKASEFVENDDNRFCLTTRGMLLCDEISTYLRPILAAQ
jgi:oxygen-independent coproporphyrinogen-3 oxidase